MGRWRTYEERLEYHREYNARYRAENPNRIAEYKQHGKAQRIKKKEKEAADASACHRRTDLKDMREEGEIL